eukprot:939609_1
MSKGSSQPPIQKDGKNQGGNSSTNSTTTSNNNNGNNKPAFLNPNELYRPIMLHMKCRGSLSFSSLHNNNNNNNKRHTGGSDSLKSSLPICQGIQSRLQPVREYP